MASLVDTVVDHGLGARYEDIPDAARRAVATFLLDSLGVGIAGAAHPLTPDVRRAALSWGGEGRAHVWGPGKIAVNAATAAFINGFQIHCQEFDCVHEPAVVHPMATILAAMMACAETAEAPVSGQSLCAALTVAVDLAAGLGIAAKSPIRFFRPANAGLFGAVLGICRLRQFTPDQAKDALGYALAFNAGTMQAHVEGKPALPLQIANAARNAVAATDLAGLGIPGPHDSLEGPFGYFRLFEDEVDASELRTTLGRTWRIAEVSHKPFPTGRACQGGIELMARVSARGLTPDEIEAVRLTAPPLIGRLVGRPWRADMTPAYARLCFAYCGAVALARGTVALGDFSSSSLANPETARLARNIEVLDDGSGNPSGFAPQVIEIRLKSGEVIRERTDALVGSPAKPLSRAQNEEKFRACLTFGFTGPASPIADELIFQVSQLGELKDAAVLSLLASGQEFQP